MSTHDIVRTLGLVCFFAQGVLAQPVPAIVLVDARASFGAAVAAAGDVDGDGVGDVIVGSRDGGPVGAGFAKIFSGLDGHEIRTLDGLYGGDHFGAAVAGVGDIDGDGKADVAVGAPQPNGSQYPPGSGLTYTVYAGGYVRVYSGGTGALLHSWPSMPSIVGNAIQWTGYGQTVAGIGDIDGDGVGDVLTAAQGSGALFPGGLCFFAAVPGVAGNGTVRSGLSGAVLRTHTGVTADPWPTWATSAGDIDADGVPDYILAGPGRLAFSQTCFFQTIQNPHLSSRLLVISGATGATLQTHTGERVNAIVAAPAGDCNGDGRDDVVARVSGQFAAGPLTFGTVFGSPTGALIQSVTDPMIEFQMSCCGVGDRNGDGIGDFLLGDGSQSRARIFSGFDGTVLEHLTGPQGFGRSCCHLGDLDGDGHPEFAVGGEGLVRVYWGTPLPMALSTHLGPGCGPSALPPDLLFSGPPILGLPLTVTYSNGTPFAQGAVFVGSAPPIPTTLGGCPVHLDLAAAVILDLVTLDASGSWSNTFSLPFVPTAAGLSVRLQGFAAPVATPLGLEITGASELRFGY